VQHDGVVRHSNRRGEQSDTPAALPIPTSSRLRSPIELANIGLNLTLKVGLFIGEQAPQST
jgi:hypothetical protein